MSGLHRAFSRRGALRIGVAALLLLSVITSIGVAPDARAQSSSFTVGQSLVVNTDSVTLRNGAGTKNAALGTLVSGDEVEVLNGPLVSGGYTWYQVDTDLGVGWVAGEFLATSVSGSGSTSAGTTTATTWSYGKWLRVDTDWVSLRVGAGTSYDVITKLVTGEWVMIKDGPTTAGGVTWYKVYTDYGDGWVAGEFLNTTVTYTGTPGTSSSTTSGSSTSSATWSYGQWLRVDTDWVTLRSGAGTSYSAITQLTTGEWVMVKDGPTVAGGLNWYKVYTDYGDGWVAGKYLNTKVTYTGTPGTSSASTSSSSASSATWSYGQWLRVNTDWVTLRSSSSASSTAITQLTTGEWVMIKDGPVVSGGYSWYKVYTDYGDGWVAGEFLAKTVTYTGTTASTSGSASSTSTKTWSYGQWLRVDTDYVTLRSGAGTSFAALKSLGTGEWVMVKDGPTTADGYSWYKVYTDYGDGWVAGKFLNTTVTYTGAAGTTGGGTSAGSTSAFEYGDWLRVNTDWVTLRSGAGTAYSAISKLTTGQWVMVQDGPVASGGYQWYQVYTDDGNGWVAGEFLAVTVTYTGGSTSSAAAGGAATEFSYAEWVVVADVNVALRNGPGTSYTAEATFAEGDWVMIQDGPETANGYAWYQVWSDYGVGWVAGQFLAEP